MSGGKGKWGWPAALAEIVGIIVVGLLIAMCAGWMPWQHQG